MSTENRGPEQSDAVRLWDSKDGHVALLCALAVVTAGVFFFACVIGVVAAAFGHGSVRCAGVVGCLCGGLCAAFSGAKALVEYRRFMTMGVFDGDDDDGEENEDEPEVRRPYLPVEPAREERVS